MKKIKGMFWLIFLLSILMLPANIYTADTTQYTNDLVPAMTSNTSPAPYVIEASSYYSNNYLPYKAFDNIAPSDSNNEWFASDSPSFKWIKVDFGASNEKKISKIIITSGYVSHSDDGIKDWELWASNDNSNFSKVTQGTAQSHSNEYIFDNYTAYRYYRLNVLSSYHAGGYIAISEIELMEKIAQALQSPANLAAVPLNSKVDLSWDATADATSYNVKRSTTIGGPYTTIANNITTTTYSDTTVTNDTMYYYVVTAVNLTEESTNSNEVLATPKAEVLPGGNKAILELVMTNGTIKEFDLTNTELNAFLNWYDDRSSGSGKAYYALPKNSNVLPFLSRTEYIQFDKIFSFEVKDYND